mmetsp:Transcript_4923/g.12064  ORF Transcript_4923/g.12064 Transcript_4923/m.12064 type:complete len:515 (-) Transcript_4923:352-1896(-)
MGDYWQLTVDLLQNPSNPIVDKPKLQEKYLTKPPFRYLHDVITAVQTNTGFAPGIYSGDELVAQSIQDKDAKVTYLSKMIDVVGLVLGEHVPAKPLKIVAGLEPENTNVFLQMLAQACRLENGADAVQRVLAGEHQPNPGERAPAKAPPPAARPSSRPSSQQRLEEEAGGFGLSTAPPPQEPEPEAPRMKRSDSDKERKSRSKAPPPPAEEEPPAPKTKSRSKPKEEPPPLGPPEPSGRAASPPPAGDDPMRKLMRPQSARKAPPKLPSAAPAVPAGAGRAPTLQSQGSMRRASGTGDRPPSTGGMQPQAVRPVAVFEDGVGGNSDDEVEVVHSAQPVAVGPNRDVGREQGVLVKNILAAEQDLKKAGADAAAAQEQEEGGGTGIILKRLGKPSAANPGAGAVKSGDTGAIRELVQKLCQASHPLAKSMDYLGEDLENMAKEYRFWQMERRVFADKLADEQRMVDHSAAADAQVADLDGQLKQVRDRILGLKAAVLRNDDTISKLLAMAVGVAK